MSLLLFWGEVVIVFGNIERYVCFGMS